MFIGVVSIQQNNLNPILAKILIKERENFAQLAYCGIDYLKEAYVVLSMGQTNYNSKKWL